MYQKITKNSRETRKFAKDLAARILKIGPKEKAWAIGLAGELGAGKTTFVQGFARGLGIKEKILSPTFVILKKFSITEKPKNQPPQKLFKNFYHIDCYRIKTPEEILDLGWREIVEKSQNIVVIEWAEKIKKILPRTAAIIKFRHIARGERKIEIHLPKP